MADYLAELHRTATATTAGVRSFDSGSEGIEIIFELDEPLPSGEKTITGLLWLTDRALDRTKKTLKAVGVNPDDASYENETQLCDAIEGKQFKLVVALEAPNSYHKTERWICRFINGPKAEPSGSALARLRGAQGALPLSKPAEPDDDVPF